MSSYRLIEAEKTSFPVQFMCRMLGVSRSGYYGWKMRPPCARDRADATLTERIREIRTSAAAARTDLRGSTPS